jgi:hypothetical protein
MASNKLHPLARKLNLVGESLVIYLRRGAERVPLPHNLAGAVAIAMQNDCPCWWPWAAVPLKRWSVANLKTLEVIEAEQKDHQTRLAWCLAEAARRNAEEQGVE